MVMITREVWTFARTERRDMIKLLNIDASNPHAITVSNVLLTPLQCRSQYQPSEQLDQSQLRESSYSGGKGKSRRQKRPANLA
jgi:hypothetical protein